MARRAAPGRGRCGVSAIIDTGSVISPEEFERATGRPWCAASSPATSLVVRIPCDRERAADLRERVRVALESHGISDIAFFLRGC